MKKIFAVSLIAIVSIFAVSAAFADEGEADEGSNVAPAIIQAPASAGAQQAAAPEAVQAAAAGPAPVSAAAGTAEPGPAFPAPPAVPSGTRVIREASLRAADAQSMEGSVVSVTPSGVMQPRSKVVIADASGAQAEFSVKVLAVIYDSTGAILSADQLRQGDRVLVNYRIKGSGAKEATSVKVLK